MKLLLNYNNTLCLEENLIDPPSLFDSIIMEIMNGREEEEEEEEAEGSG